MTTILGIIGLLSLVAQTSSVALDRVRVIIPERDNLQYMSFLTALGAGKFVEEGLDVELDVPNTPREAEDFVRDRRAHVAVLSPPSYLRLIADDAGFILVANLMQNDGIELVVDRGVLASRNLLPDAPLVDRIRALKGMKLGVAPGPKSRLAKLLRAGGLDPTKDVELVTVAGPSQNDLFGEHGVDALYCHTPYLERALVEQNGVVFIDQAKGEIPELANRQIHAMLVSRELRDMRPDLVRRLVRAITKAEALIQRSEPDTVAALLGVVQRDRALVEKIVNLYRPAMPRTPHVSSEGLNRALELFPANEPPPDLGRIALASYVDDSFADEEERGEEPLVLGAEALEEAEADAAAVPIEDVIVTAERIAEPARPDTTLRITGKQLLERGVTNLGQALDQISDTPVRASGRQVLQVNVRGARKGGVLLLLDGVPISDPFYGNFDVTAIPSTDIAEIRLSLTPASPLDGPSGNGGVIEVLTRSAQGSTQARAQVQASSAPSMLAAGTARGVLGGDFHVRISVSGSFEGRDLPVALADGTRRMLDSDTHNGTVGLRVERRADRGVFSVDVAGTHRKYLIPPGEYPGAGVSVTPDESLFRGVLSGSIRVGQALGSARIYSVYEDHDGINYRDSSFDEIATREHFIAHRTGGSAQLDLPFTQNLRLTTVTHLLIEGGEDTITSNGHPVETAGSIPIVEPAVGAVWITTPWLTLDGAAGLSVPFGGSKADPWPEGKLTATFTLAEAYQLRLVGARKGRLPSLRDRFSPTQGNPAIGPELGTSVEGSMLAKPLDWTSFEVSGFWRLTNGLIRIPPGGPRGPNGVVPVENVGDVTVRGFEARADFSPLPWLGGGVAYAFANAQSEVLGRDPLDFFPKHRLELFASSRYETRGGVWARIRYTGTRLDNGMELSPYTTLDTSAWLKLGPTQLTARLENLLDQGYELRDGIPGFGRTVFFGVEGTLK